ncbi:MAG: glycosyltransferase [Planctomycetota bacterium]
MLIAYACLAAYLMVTALKFALSRHYLRQCPDVEVDDRLIDVTVLQPIRSGDPLLQDTLSRSLSTAPRGAQFWLLVDEDDPEAQRVCEVLRQRFADRVHLLHCPPPNQGQNPKAVKLDWALPKVCSEFTAVLDDDTWLPHRNLNKAVARLADCDLYTGLPCYFPGGSLWASLVTHFVNNNSVMTYLALLPLAGPLTINGMFYVARTDTLRRLGGWGPTSHHLCDDLAIASAFHERGLRIHQGVTTQYLNTTVRSAAHYFSLMHRWYVFADILVRRQTARNKALIISLLGFPPLLLLIGLLTVMGGPIAACCLLVALVTRHLLIHHLLWRVTDATPPVSWGFSLVAELIQPVHWCHARLSRKITWRQRPVLAHRDGRFAYLESSRTRGGTETSSCL